MRICYLAWHGSVHTRRWVGWFAERGHEVHVVTCGGGDVRDLDAEGTPLPLRYRVHELGEPRFGKLGYLLKLWKARRVVRSIDADVVHAHWLTSYGLLALAARADGRGVGRRRPTRAAAAAPLVVTAHGDDVLIAPRGRLMRMIVRRVLRAAELITVPSETMRSEVEQLAGGDAEHPLGEVVAFQYGVETGRLGAAGRAVRGEVDSARGGGCSSPVPVRIVSARALLDLYRIDALLDSVAVLRERGVDVQVDLLGDGPERAPLEARAQDLGIAAACTFHGTVTPAQVERMVAASDVYVSVSESDGVSLALLEALALGAVPVLSDIPANRPWVNDGRTGVLVEIDGVSIADGIEAALRLDRERVASDNLAVVAERADRDTNLAACEVLVDGLVGVQWDATPVDVAARESASGSRDAAA